MDEKDTDKYLNDFKKADITKKLDMWFYALEQEAIWSEVISDMSDIATKQSLVKK